MTDVSIADILKSPAAYEGKLVRLHGTMDQCDAYNCHLCMDFKVSRATCISIVDWRGAEDSDDWNLKRRERARLDEFYRFADVTVIATVDFTNPAEASALDQQFADAIDAGADITSCPPSRTRICPEPGDGWLTKVSVEAITLRRPATDGLITAGPNGRLKPAPPDIEKALQTAFASAFGYQGAYGPAFFDPDEPQSATICIDEDQGGPARWPKTQMQLLASPANDYRCYGARLDDGRWTFPWYYRL